LARTDSREDQGFEGGEAGGTERVPSLGSRATGKHVFGRVERDLIAVWGVRQLRESAGVDETDGDKTREAAFPHTGG